MSLELCDHGLGLWVDDPHQAISQGGHEESFARRRAGGKKLNAIDANGL